MVLLQLNVKATYIFHWIKKIIIANIIYPLIKNQNQTLVVQSPIKLILD